jgi:hypothetical protein
MHKRTPTQASGRRSRVSLTEQASAAKTRPTVGRAGPRAHRPVSVYHKLGGPAYADLPPSKQRVFVRSKPKLCGARAVRAATAFDASAACPRAARSHCLLATLLRARPASMIASRRRDARPHERRLDAFIRSRVDHFARPRSAERRASTSTLPTTPARPSHSALRRKRDTLSDFFRVSPRELNASART